ncbi:class I SAM-dependent methyltransferase [Mycobacterium sp. NPDC050853]|uniref:O-methyltransferase n=1 Tax=Mycobacteriaceae TaxID=1762 RepID=UPI0015E00BFC|nr:class I SAM-dependent methyltransferase [Mycobacteroides sp. LB1]
MNSLETPKVVGVLERLFGEAETTDRSAIAELLDNTEPGADPVATALDAEVSDYKEFYHRSVQNFLCVSPVFGRFLYICGRAVNATRIVEFGTSFGVSTIHLACAVRDNGGGLVVGTELEQAKATRAYGHLKEAGVDDLVDIRVGDALDMLSGGVGGAIDLVHLDGAMSLYRPVLQLLEPHLRPNALIVAENATPDYLDYIEDIATPYVSLPLPFRDVRGNELTVFTG